MADLTLDNVLARVPVQFRPWAASYAPIFMAMTGSEIMAWLDRIIKGDVVGAYRDMLSRMNAAQALSEWDALNAEWQQANTDNAASIALQKTALTAIMKVLLAIALAAAGF